MNTPVKAVIFDLDGTLLDTIEDIADSMNHALSLFGFRTFAPDAYKRFVGLGVDVLVARVLEGTGATDKAIDAVGRMYRKTYALWQRRKTRPYPGIPELVERLHRDGVLLAVLSNKPDADTNAVVAHYFPDEPFALVVGQQPGIPTKPDPTAANAIVVALGLTPADVLYVGDTGTDMTTAARAGLTSAGALWGFRDASELLAAGACHLVARPEELLDLVAGRNVA